MDIEQLASRLAHQAGAVRAAVTGCSDHQARWKPDRASWSILEVINHLGDEECEDFRPRIDAMLRGGGEVWFPIDPEGWVTQRGYNQRDLEPSLDRFLVARQESLAWLGGLGDVDWTAEYEAPFGSIRAGDILAAWVAHDLLHLRQLVELQYTYLVQTVGPFSVRYAGQW
jgi:hypothetical protein